MALYTQKQIENLISKGKLTKEQCTGIKIVRERIDRHNLTDKKRKRRTDPRIRIPRIVIEEVEMVTQKQIGRPRKITAQRTKGKFVEAASGVVYGPVAKDTYSDEERLEAAVTHFAIGSVKRTAELTKIPAAKIREWKEQDWWFQVQARCTREANEELDAKFSKAIEKCVDVALKQIDEGETIYDQKRGELVKVPLKNRDITVSAAVMFDKRQLLRGEATKITKNENSEEHLRKLATMFEEYMQTKELKDAKVIDVREYTEETTRSKSGRMSELQEAVPTEGS